MDTFGPDRLRPSAAPPPASASRPPRRLLALIALAALAGPGCRWEMYDQPRYDPLETSTFFIDGASARPLVTGTVPAATPPGLGGEPAIVQAAWSDPARYEHFFAGKVNGEPATTFPFEITQRDLLRGQERYMIHCYPCHGATGDGRGMIVQRGFPPPPPFYGKRPSADTDQAAIVYDDLRQAPVGHFFDVITNGRGVMYSYKSRIVPEDRWRIIAYIRALQLSQYATADELDAADLEQINQAGSEEQGLLKEAQR